MQAGIATHPNDGPLLSEYGRFLVREGQPAEALMILQRADAAGVADAQVFAAEGAALDQLNRHRQAQERHLRALSLKPNDPKILANLVMSYALSNDMKKAEKTLRQAAKQPGADARVRQNLVLVLGLQGKYEEAAEIAAKDLPPHEVETNIAYLRDMRRQPDRWREMQQADRS